MAHDAFISYSHDDKAPADAVCHRLEEAGVRCWIAPRDVAAGKRWAEAIVDAITEARLVIVIFTAAANASRHVLDEVSTALDIGRLVIPFRLEDIGPTGELRLHLGGLHWLDALSPPLDAHIDRLIETTKRNLPSLDTGQDVKPPTIANVAAAVDAHPPRETQKPKEVIEPESPFFLKIWLWIAGGAFFSGIFVAIGLSGKYARGETSAITADIFTSIIFIVIGLILSLLIRILLIACMAASRAITRRNR